MKITKSNLAAASFWCLYLASFLYAAYRNFH